MTEYRTSDFDDILEHYRSILNIAANGEYPSADKINNYIELLDMAVNAHTRIADSMKREYHKWNKDADRFAALRNDMTKLIQTIRGKNNGD